MRGIIYGMTVILHEGFNEEKMINDIFYNRATIMSVVTTMLLRLLSHFENNGLPSMSAGGFETA